MPRTDKTTVIKILGPDYDGFRDLQVFINTASRTVDRVVALSATYGRTGVGPLDDSVGGAATDVEAWYAAHLYANTGDRELQSRSTGKVSGQFTGQTGKGLEATYYGQTAKQLDYTGVLNAIDKRTIVDAGWLGLNPSDQTDYELRR